MLLFFINNLLKNMKIKITQPGWEGFTGALGMFEFENGVSVEDIGRADAAFLAGIVSIEDFDTGKNPSLSQRIVDSYSKEAKVPAVEPIVPVVTSTAHTKESLELIADKSGIKGIREVSDPMGIKGNAIAEIIGKILLAESQAGVVGEPVVAAVVTPE